MENIVEKQSNLYEKIAELIDSAHSRVKTVVNTTMVYTYYEIGRYIVEDEQLGNHRSQYGKNVLQDLSSRLTSKFGDGWSYANLRKIRQFYLTYSNLINSVYQIRI